MLSLFCTASERVCAKAEAVNLRRDLLENGKLGGRTAAGGKQRLFPASELVSQEIAVTQGPRRDAPHTVPQGRLQEKWGRRGRVTDC